MLVFLKNLAGVKMDKVAQAGIEALVRWDPKSASEAELRTMEQNLDALGPLELGARHFELAPCLGIGLLEHLEIILGVHLVLLLALDLGGHLLEHPDQGR